jgi:hypothetical protein
MGLRYLGPTSLACQTIVHGSLQLAQWQVKFYQNTERALDLMQQGLNQQQISQALWDESCREQDTIGVRTHHRMIVGGSACLRFCGESLGCPVSQWSSVTSPPAVSLLRHRYRAIGRRNLEEECVSFLPVPPKLAGEILSHELSFPFR